jgi:hypothetical protein
MTETDKFSPLPDSILRQLRETVSGGQTKKNLSIQIGIPVSTLKDAFAGKKVSTRTKQAISQHFHVSEKTSVQELVASLSPTEEIPKISPDRMQVLMTVFKSGADQTICAMREVVNAGFGDRKKFRENLDREIELLRVLSRALTSEDALKRVQQELGRTEI